MIDAEMRKKMHERLDNILDLGADVVITSQKDWDNNLSKGFVTLAEHEKAVQKAKIDGAKSLHNTIAFRFDLIEKIQPGYKGYPLIQAKELQDCICIFIEMEEGMLEDEETDEPEGGE